ncbi:hypothetical protein Tco_1052521, partial [Tanacetum coccineum]
IKKSVNDFEDVEPTKNDGDLLTISNLKENVMKPQVFVFKKTVATEFKGLIYMCLMEEVEKVGQTMAYKLGWEIKNLSISIESQELPIVYR